MIFSLFKSKQIQFLEAVEDKNTNKVKRLIGHSEVDVNFKDDNEQTPLHTAASEGCVDICNLLIEHGADVNIKNKWGETLHVNATSEYVATCSNDPEQSRDLHLAAVYAMASVPVFDQSITHEAADKGYLEICELLIKHGADVHTKDSRNRCIELPVLDISRFVSY